MLVVVASCAGAGAAACAGAGSVAAGDVIDCDADGVLGCEAIGAEGAGVAASVLDDGAASELDDVLATGSLAARRLLRVDAVTLFAERDASREGLGFDAGAASISFASRLSLVDALDFGGSVVDLGDSIPASVDVFMLDSASVVEEVLVLLLSATAGAAATGLPRAGIVGTGCEATWRSNANAPTITMAVIVPNAIPKCLTRLLPKGECLLESGFVRAVAYGTAESARAYSAGLQLPTLV
jgi:hypothetical protein